MTSTFSVHITVITSHKPDRLTKRFLLSTNGLVKQPGGALVEGQAEVRKVTGHKAFAALLSGLKPNQALIYGQSEATSVRVLSEDLWNKQGCPPGTVPRTREHFSWCGGPAVLMLDYDPEAGRTALARDELVAALRESVPGLANAAMTWVPSASSHIVNTDTDKDLTELRGQRLYMFVKNGQDIERAGKAIVSRLWDAGHGFIKISSSGSRLERTIFDASVWQSNRLDFAAGAMCELPLAQRRGKPNLIPGEMDLADTSVLIPDPTPGEINRVKAAIKKAKEAVADEAAEVRRKWLEERVDEMVGPDADQETRAAAREQAQKAVEGGVLSGDFLLRVVQGGDHTTVTVRDILADPAKYHGCLTLDPLEPHYQGGKAVGKLYTLGSTARLNSFAHGKRVFTLERQPIRIEVPTGKTAEATQRVLEVLREAPSFFDLGDAMVVVDEGKLLSLDEHSLALHLGCYIQFFRRRLSSQGTWTESLIDPPKGMVKGLLSPGTDRKLKPLIAVVTAQIIRRDGSVLRRPGYDPATRLFLAPPDDIPEVPDTPTLEQVQHAVRTVMEPFKDFPYASAVDRGVALAAAIASVVRPVLPTAPAFAFDAPIQGAGKTLLAKAVCAMGTGAEPTVMPPVAGEEARKRLLAIFRGGERGIIWDNVTEALDDASIAMALTSETFSDRLLGASAMVTVPNRALLAITGNNLQFSGDMPRRVLTCRIDPRTDALSEREFALDPLQYVLEHRQLLVAAALTIIRGWVTCGAKPASAPFPSFETFDALVRQPVAWVAAHVLPDEFADPIKAVREVQAVDPERDALSTLHRAWRRLFGGQAKFAREVFDRLETERTRSGSPEPTAVELEGAIKDLLGTSVITSAIALGRVLAKFRGREVDGRRLEREYDNREKTWKWRVDHVGNSDGTELQGGLL
jgi:hypothetical protein